MDTDEPARPPLPSPEGTERGTPWLAVEEKTVWITRS